jgi:predicted ArsR family transcriptional regulator
VSERYVDTMVVTTVREMARALGWPVPVVRQRLDALVASGVADRPSQDTYRAAGARPS